jgi:hypothetical protein
MDGTPWRMEAGPGRDRSMFCPYPLGMYWPGIHWISQIPPDLVVKFQPVDIVEVVL